MLDRTAIRAQLDHITLTAALAPDSELADTMRMLVSALNTLCSKCAERELIAGFRVVDAEHPKNFAPMQQIVISVVSEVI